MWNWIRHDLALHMIHYRFGGHWVTSIHVILVPLGVWQSHQRYGSEGVVGSYRGNLRNVRWLHIIPWIRFDLFCTAIINTIYTFSSSHRIPFGLNRTEHMVLLTLSSMAWGIVKVPKKPAEDSFSLWSTDSIKPSEVFLDQWIVSP